MRGTFEGAEHTTKWEKFRILLRRVWNRFRDRPGWHFRVLITEIVFHRKLLGQSLYRWLAHTLVVFGFVATFIADMTKTKGFTTFYLVEFSKHVPVFSFAHEFETGSELRCSIFSWSPSASSSSWAA